MNELFVKARSILPGIWRYRWSGLLVAILLGCVGTAITARIPDRFESGARVFVDTQTILRPLLRGLTVQPDISQQVSLMAKTLLSRPNIENIIKDAGLEPVTTDGAVANPQMRERLISRLQNDIQFNALGRNDIYSVSYRSDTPESAWRVVSAFVDVFVERSRGDNARGSEAARQFLDEQIAIYEHRLIEAENALKGFKIENVGRMPDSRQDYVSRSAAAREELSAALAELRQAVGSRDALQREAALESPGAGFSDALAAVMPMPETETDRRLKDTHKQLDELSIRYTEEHPDTLNLKFTIAQLENRKAAEVAEFNLRRPELAQSLPSARSGSSAYNTIRAALAQAEATVAAQRARVETARSRLNETGNAAKAVTEVETALAQLNRDYEINKKGYEDLLARRQAAEITGDLGRTSNLAEFRIVDPPRVSTTPVSPQRDLLFAAVLVGSVLAGLGFTIMRTLLRPVFDDAESITENTGTPIVGVISAVLDERGNSAQRLADVGFYLASASWLLLFGISAWYLMKHGMPAAIGTSELPAPLNRIFGS